MPGKAGFLAYVSGIPNIPGMWVTEAGAQGGEGGSKPCVQVKIVGDVLDVFSPSHLPPKPFCEQVYQFHLQHVSSNSSHLLAFTVTPQPSLYFPHLVHQITSSVEFCASSLVAFLVTLQAEGGELVHGCKLAHGTSLLESLHQLSVVPGITSSSVLTPASPTCFGSAHPLSLPIAPTSVIIVPWPYWRIFPAKHLDAFGPLFLLFSLPGLLLRTSPGWSIFRLQECT